MMRLGTSFTMMLMVRSGDNLPTLETTLRPAADKLQLRCHVDPIDGQLHKHATPNMRVTVFGTDRPGIVAQISRSLAETGFHILDLESDVAGSDDAPIYVMHIEGVSTLDEDALAAKLVTHRQEGIELDVQGIDTMVG
jgi:glycine cleavage system transcriptional repressor